MLTQGTLSRRHTVIEELDPARARYVKTTMDYDPVRQSFDTSTAKDPQGPLSHPALRLTLTEAKKPRLTETAASKQELNPEIASRAWATSESRLENSVQLSS